MFHLASVEEEMGLNTEAIARLKQVIEMSEASRWTLWGGKDRDGLYGLTLFRGAGPLYKRATKSLERIRNAEATTP